MVSQILYRSHLQCLFFIKKSLAHRCCPAILLSIDCMKHCLAFPETIQNSFLIYVLSNFCVFLFSYLIIWTMLFHVKATCLIVNRWCSFCTTIVKTVVDTLNGGFSWKLTQTSHFYENYLNYRSRVEHAGCRHVIFLTKLFPS